MRILLVEDEGGIASFVQNGLTEAGYSVDWIALGYSALEAVEETEYDLIILDLVLPDTGGLSLLEKLRNRQMPPPVLILSARNSLNDRVRGLEPGAGDHLTKPFKFAELLARVRVLLRRGKTPPERLQAGGLTLDCVRRRVSRDGRAIDLAPKEFSILEYLMRNLGRPMNRTAIVEHVWDSKYDGLSSIVDVYIRHLRAKIDDGAEIKLIRTVRGVGYMIEAAGAGGKDL